MQAHLYLTRLVHVHVPIIQLYVYDYMLLKLPVIYALEHSSRFLPIMFKLCFINDKSTIVSINSTFHHITFLLYLSDNYYLYKHHYLAFIINYFDLFLATDYSCIIPVNIL